MARPCAKTKNISERLDRAWCEGPEFNLPTAQRETETESQMGTITIEYDNTVCKMWTCPSFLLYYINHKFSFRIVNKEAKISFRHEMNRCKPLVSVLR